MFEILKSSSKLKIIIFIILELNFIYAVGYTGNIIIGGYCSFESSFSMLLQSLLFILSIPIIGYVIYRFISKRVAWNIAMVILDDYPGFMLLSEDKVKVNPSLENEIDVYRKNFMDTMTIMGEYDSISVIIKYNYFIIFTFSTIATVCRYVDMQKSILWHTS